MDIRDILNYMLFLDGETARKILVWGNLLLGILVAFYQSTQKTCEHRVLLKSFTAAKFIQFFAWVLMLYERDFPFRLGFIMGNTFLFFGFFVESRVILGISGIKKRWVHRLQLAVFILLTAVFIWLELTLEMDYKRFPLSLFVIMIIFCFPGFACFYHIKRSPLRVLIGSLYLSIFVFSVLRNVNILFNIRIALISPRLTDSIVDLVFIFVLFIGGAGFLLLFKEDADRKILDLAYLDSLTGLLNRRHFMDEALVMFERHARYREELAVVFFDIDHFKAINDTYGHSFGDEVLRDISSLMRKNVRTTDLSCRWGGEEFVILMANSSQFQARSVANRLRQAIKLSHFIQHPAFAYTISVGVYVGIPRSVPGDTLESFIEKSDYAMYRAKKNGRDCVVKYEEGMENP